jgi:hypothetical protein
MENWCRFVVDQQKVAVSSSKDSFCVCVYHLVVSFSLLDIFFKTSFFTTPKSLCRLSSSFFLYTQVLYLDSLEVDVPVNKCAVRDEAWTSRLIGGVLPRDTKDDGEYGNLQVSHS